MSFIAWLKKHVCEDDAWITVHPNASGPGSPVLLDDEGYIKGGMGGKFTGQRIDLMPRKSGYGVPVSENDPLNKSTPGFLRTFRYNLKAPENVASQATNNAPKSDNISPNTNNEPSPPVQLVTPTFSTSGPSMTQLMDGISKSWHTQRYLTETERSELKNAAITKYNEAVKAIENSGNRIENKNAALLECTDAIYTKMLYDSYVQANKNAVSNVYHKSAVQLEGEMTVKTGIMNGLIKYANGELTTTPSSLGGAKKAAPMSEENADHGNGNPNYLSSSGYQTNCQTCVIAYEARLRGYDVTAGPRTKNNTLGYLAKDTTKAWIDPKTGMPPKSTKCPGYISNSKEFQTFLTDRMNPGERYNLRFNWMRKSYGHIVSAEKTSTGQLRIFDPQTGKTFYGETARTEYLDKIDYSGGYGMRDTRPDFYRVDNLAFNEDACNKALKRGKRSK